MRGRFVDVTAEEIERVADLHGAYIELDKRYAYVVLRGVQYRAELPEVDL